VIGGGRSPRRRQGREALERAELDREREREGELLRSVPGQTIGHVYVVHMSNRRRGINTRLQLETCI
jgi:ubiquinone biosynthesis protein Coq4